MGLYLGPHHSAHQKHTNVSFIKELNASVTWDREVSDDIAHPGCNHPTVQRPDPAYLFLQMKVLEHTHSHSFTLLPKAALFPYKYSIGWVVVTNSVVQKAKSIWPFSEKCVSPSTVCNSEHLFSGYQHSGQKKQLLKVC